MKIKALLRAGVWVNNNRENLLTLCLDSDRKLHRKKELALLLFAAGEKLIEINVQNARISYAFQMNKTLKYFCAEKTIRKSFTRDDQGQSVLHEWQNSDFLQL